MRQPSYEILQQREQDRKNYLQNALQRTNRNSQICGKIREDINHHLTQNEQYQRPFTADQCSHANTSSSLKKAYFYRKLLNKSSLCHLSPDNILKCKQKSFENKKVMDKPPSFFQQTLKNKNNETLSERVTVDFINIDQLRRGGKDNFKNVTFGQFIERKKVKRGRMRKLNEAWSGEQNKKGNQHIELQIEGSSRFIRNMESPFTTAKQQKASHGEKAREEDGQVHLQPKITSLNDLQKIDIDLYSRRICSYLKKEKANLNSATDCAKNSYELGLHIHSLRRASPNKNLPFHQSSHDNRLQYKSKMVCSNQKPHKANKPIRINKSKKTNLTDDLQGWHVGKDNELIEEDIFSNF